SYPFVLLTAPFSRRGVPRALAREVDAVPAQTSRSCGGGNGSEPFRLLVVDDDQGICDVLGAALSRRYDVTTVTDSERALQMCRDGAFHMVVSDINMPRLNGIDLVSEVRRLCPSTIPVLMTGYDINTYLSQVLERGIANIITKTAPFNFTEIETELDGLLTGSIFGLSRYLLDDHEILRRYEVCSSEESRRVRKEIAQLFTERFGSARDVELVVDEIVSNAVYHAPVLPDGSPKYEDLSDVQLEADDYITVECGADSEKYGVSVADNSGRLTKETVLERIERHVSGKGLADRRGRGIHITRMLSDRMIINIKRGKRTEVVLLNYFTAKYRGFKPLYINEV
ncbi:MAG: response regulator, partial [Chitinivibrionales bacterium]|nr:response regulator [Chitinivibrionales bacterium]